MTRSKRMTPLINLAERRQDEAARQLAASTNELHEQQRRHEMLQQYEREYAVRAPSPTTRVSSTLLANREAFHQRLQAAVDEQAGIVEHRREICDVERAALISASRNTTVLNKLTQNYKAQESRVEAGREQRVLDDLGARSSSGKGFSP